MAPSMKTRLKTFAYKAMMTYRARDIDAYVVGFPKTGNTWVWFMIRQLFARVYGLTDDEVGLVLFSDLWKWRKPGTKRPDVPVIHTTHNLPGFWSDSGEGTALIMTPFKRKKILLLIRNAKDTLVSLWFHNRYRRNPPVFQGGLDEMLHSPRYGLQNYLDYYTTWYQYRDQLDDLLLIRYEDNHADPAKIVRQTAAFLGISGLTDALVAEVIAASSFTNMRHIEEGDLSHGAFLTPPASGVNAGFKMRAGKVGGYREHMDEETVRYLDERIARELPAFYGYTGRSGNTEETRI